MTGNKSGALLLTTFVLMLGATNERFTKFRAVSAVQDGNGLPKGSWFDKLAQAVRFPIGELSAPTMRTPAFD
jgi:hypothetical protein